MSNKFNANLNNVKVVLKKEAVQPKYQDVDEHRVATVLGGLGAYPTTRGKSIRVRFYDYTEADLVSSDIESIAKICPLYNHLIPDSDCQHCQFSDFHLVKGNCIERTIA